MDLGENHSQNLLQRAAQIDEFLKRYRELGAGRHDQGEVATALGMSVASLRRRLGEAGLQFRDVRAHYLNSLAQAALEEGSSIADIAENLGFSDGRSFARAFRQWNGVAPGDYRRRSI